ncbi:MAG: zinc dependent phospholipase C family protein [Lachnospiraceae bacterium]|nr:zinc dependent phospholipase C family protein [Lachnospiraceae bacterium]
MPGFLTHYTFGNRVLEGLNDGYMKDCINKNIKVYNLGLQGPDIFLYFIPYKINKKLNLGSIMHRNKTKEFFLNSVDKIIKCKDEKEKEIMIAYICGFYGHFSLDKNCHPYIYYKSEYLYTNKNYNEKHIKLESDIDYIYARNIFRRRDISINYRSLVEINKKQRKIVARLISKVCNKLYSKIWLNQTIAECSILSFAYVTNFFNDSTGKRYKYIRKIEKTITGHENISSLFNGNCYKIKYSDSMNLFHKEWINPWKKDEKKNLSFYDLAELAAKELVEFIKITELCINERKDSLLKECLKNCSYITGLEIK